MGDRLRKARESAGLSQQELAVRLQLSRNTVGAYEKADDPPINWWMARAWAEVCGVDPEWLSPNGPHGPGVTDGEWYVPWLTWPEPVAA